MTRLITRVGEGGLEPPRPEGHWHLKPARLPFRHSPERQPVDHIIVVAAHPTSLRASAKNFPIMASVDQALLNCLIQFSKLPRCPNVAVYRYHAWVIRHANKAFALWAIFQNKCRRTLNNG